MPVKVDLDKQEESIDQDQILQEKVSKSFRNAALQDKKYIDNISTYRRRVTQVNLISRHEMIQENKASALVSLN